MNYQMLADQYVDINTYYNDLKMQLEKTGKERKELMGRLTEAMDADGVSQLFGTDGQRLSTVNTVFGNVSDWEVFKRYVMEHGVRDEFIKEVVVKKAINSLAKTAVDTAKKHGQANAEKLMPPGLDIRYNTTLRVTKPKNGEAGFKDAAKSVIEMIVGERK